MVMFLRGFFAGSGLAALFAILRNAMPTRFR